MARGDRWPMMKMALHWSVVTSVMSCARGAINTSSPFKLDPDMLECKAQPPSCKVREDVSYDAYVPPPNMWFSPPMKVTIGLTIVKLDYNIMTASLHLDLWLRLKWFDSRLTFSAAPFGPKFDAKTDYIGVPMMRGDDTALWIPDIMVIESVNDMNKLAQTVASLYPIEHSVSISGTSNLFSSRYGEIKTYCPPSLNLFPFDEQECNVTFCSWAYDAKALELVNMESGFQKLAAPDSNEYHFVSASPESTTQTFSALGKPFSVFKWRLRLKRLPMYYVVNCVVPMLMMVVLSNLVFWIPINPNQTGSGERISYTITCMLTINAITLFTSDKRPNVGQSTWLDRWETSCMLFTFIPIVETVIVCFLNGILDDAKEYHSRKKKHLRLQNSDSDSSWQADYAKRYKSSTFVRSAAWNLSHYISPRQIDMLSRHLFPVVAYARLFYLYGEIRTRVDVNPNRYRSKWDYVALHTMLIPLACIVIYLCVLAVSWMAYYACQRITECITEYRTGRIMDDAAMALDSDSSRD